MISVITCSIKPESCKRMLKSIEETIGVEYESIVIDNREKNEGICKVYNDGAMQANGDYLLFIHEDVEIKSNNWGSELIKFAEFNANCGVIGVAGGKSIGKNFSIWDNAGEKFINLYDLVGTDKDECDENDLIYSYSNPNNEEFAQVVCLDGVFLFTQKHIWEVNRFDEKNFKSFHFYDADFTLSLAHNRKNYVYFGIKLYHFSKGKVNKAFCNSMLIFQLKWRKVLPYFLHGYKVTFKKEIKLARRNIFIYQKSGISIKDALISILKVNGLFFLLLFIMNYPKILFKSYKK